MRRSELKQRDHFRNAVWPSPFHSRQKEHNQLREWSRWADYLSVPMFGRVHFYEEDLTVFALFGPSLEFRLAHDADPLLDEGKDFAIGINVGFGFEYELAREKALQLQLRYYLDLTDSWDGGELYTVTQQRYQALMATFGFRF